MPSSRTNTRQCRRIMSSMKSLLSQELGWPNSTVTGRPPAPLPSPAVAPLPSPAVAGLLTGAICLWLALANRPVPAPPGTRTLHSCTLLRSGTQCNANHYYSAARIFQHRAPCSRLVSYCSRCDLYSLSQGPLGIGRGTPKQTVAGAFKVPLTTKWNGSKTFSWSSSAVIMLGRRKLS